MNSFSLPQEKHLLVGLLLLGIGLFNILDYFLTVEIVIVQGHQEANPLIEAILHTIYFPLVKLLIIPCLLLFIWIVRHHITSRNLTCIWAAFIVYFSLMVYFKVVFF